MLKKNDVIELNIDDISVEGAGIGRYEGRVVFVRGALPSERVKAKIIKTAKNYSAGIIEDIIIKSEYRTEPLCPVFGRCGGCTLQHLKYEAQLAYKANYVKQCMKRIGGINIETPQILPAEENTAYRNKASFPVAQLGGSIQAGFYAPYSHRIVPSCCAIQQPEVNEVKDIVVGWAKNRGVSAYDESTGQGSLRHIVVRQSSGGEIMAGIVSTEKIIDDILISKLKAVKGISSIVENINRSKGNCILGQHFSTLLGDGYITETYGGLQFRASLGSFLQVNHSQTLKLYEAALEFADINKTDVVFDLFCGIGTITLLAAQKAKSAVGIEYVRSAVDNAEENAKLNGINNAQFICGDASEKLKQAASLSGRADVVLLDPPRKGCDAALIVDICKAAPSRVVYVSCSPATLARDAAVFSENGYKLDKIMAVDMFPQTTHVETVISLQRI